MIDRFAAEYWIFVEALLEHASQLVGVGALNAHAAGWGLVGQGGGGFDAGFVLARLAAVALAVVLVSAIVRRTLTLSRETAPAAQRTPPAW